MWADNIKDIMQGLSDPRSVESDRLAWEAEVADLNGDPAEARKLYAQAASIEEAIAMGGRHESTRVYSMLLVSAVSLWFKAEAWDQVVRLGSQAIGDDDQASQISASAETIVRKLINAAKKRNKDLASAPR